MNACLLCGLIFDAEPLEIGRSRSNPYICILCAKEEPIMRTRLEQILTNHFIIEFDDEQELKNAIADTRSLLPVLRSLLLTSPDGDEGREGGARGEGRAEKKSSAPARRKKRLNTATALIPCRYGCGREISQRQITNHERKCANNPSNQGNGD